MTFDYLHRLAIVNKLFLISFDRPYHHTMIVCLFVITHCSGEFKVNHFESKERKTFLKKDHVISRIDQKWSGWKCNA